jgi:hypothetical protein
MMVKILPLKPVVRSLLSQDTPPTIGQLHEMVKNKKLTEEDAEYIVQALYDRFRKQSASREAREEIKSFSETLTEHSPKPSSFVETFATGGVLPRSEITKGIAEETLEMAKKKFLMTFDDAERAMEKESFYFGKICNYARNSEDLKELKLAIQEDENLKCFSFIIDDIGYIAGETYPQPCSRDPADDIYSLRDVNIYRVNSFESEYERKKTDYEVAKQIVFSTIRQEFKKPVAYPKISLCKLREAGGFMEKVWLATEKQIEIKRNARGATKQINTEWLENMKNQYKDFGTF